MSTEHAPAWANHSSSLHLTAVTSYRPSRQYSARQKLRSSSKRVRFSTSDVNQTRIQRSVVRLHHKATQLNYSATCKHTANCRIIKARRPEKWDGGRWRKSSDISSARRASLYTCTEITNQSKRAQHKGQQMCRPLTQLIFPNPAPILGIN